MQVCNRSVSNDGVLLAKIKTLDELKDNNSCNAAEIFIHLLENMGNAFSFRDDSKNDGKGSKKSGDGTIDNPINLDDTPIQLVIADSEDSDNILLQMRDRMERMMVLPKTQIWIH